MDLRGGRNVRPPDRHSTGRIRPAAHRDHAIDVVDGDRGGRDQRRRGEPDGVLPRLRPGPEDHVLLRDQLGERCRQLRRPLCAVVRAHQCGSRGGRVANRSPSAYEGDRGKSAGRGSSRSHASKGRGCGVSKRERGDVDLLEHPSSVSPSAYRERCRGTGPRQEAQGSHDRVPSGAARLQQALGAPARDDQRGAWVGRARRP